MGISKLEELSQSLSEKERQQFILHLDAPYLKTDLVLKKLWMAIDAPLFKEKDYKKALFSRIFGQRKYDDKEMRYLISRLNKQLENYIIQRKLESSPEDFQLIAASALSERDCEKSYSLLQHDISSQPGYRNSKYFLNQFAHAEMHLNYMNQKANRKILPDYAPTLHHLDSFYILKKLQLCCELTNLSNILKKNQEVQLIEEVMVLSQQPPFSKIPSVQIYYNILIFLKDPENESAFREVQELLKEDSVLFPPGEAGELYQYIKNYCVRKINQGNVDYIRTLFQIYQSMLKNEAFMRHTFLSQWEYKNIVSISLRLNERAWCESFINKYNHYLKPEEQQNALAYNLAYFYFSTNDFKRAIRKLREVELKDIFYQLDSRVILLKSYFELDETESFFYQVSSFRLFLLRNKNISEYQKTIYRNLIKFLAAIMRAGASNSKLKKIKDEIVKEKNVADLNWLLNKVEIAMG